MIVAKYCTAGTQRTLGSTDSRRCVLRPGKEKSGRLGLRSAPLNPCDDLAPAEIVTPIDDHGPRKFQMFVGRKIQQPPDVHVRATAEEFARLSGREQLGHIYFDALALRVAVVPLAQRHFCSGCHYPVPHSSSQRGTVTLIL
jgi:hypothetical protein